MTPEILMDLDATRHIPGAIWSVPQEGQRLAKAGPAHRLSGEILDSFHIQKLRPPMKMKAGRLGHNGKV